MEWPSSNTDLNLIEHVWGDVTSKQPVNNTKIATIFFIDIKGAWKVIIAFRKTEV